MSVFGLLKRSRQAAKEHAQKQEEAKKKEGEKTPYKHVPQHAATDALSTAPPGWRMDDRTRIMEQNRRRSAMSAAGVGMPGAGLPRVGSSLSHVSYPSVYANPIVGMPRSYSYTGGVPPHGPYNPYQTYQPYPSAYHQNYSRQSIYSPMDPNLEPPMPTSYKGKEVDRAAMLDGGMGSTPTSKGTVRHWLSASLARGILADLRKTGTSPVASSSNSTSSEDELEMKRTRRSAPKKSAMRPVSTAVLYSQSAAESYHRLHPSAQSRRVSDGSVMERYGGLLGPHQQPQQQHQQQHQQQQRVAFNAPRPQLAARAYTAPNMTMGPPPPMPAMPANVAMAMHPTAVQFAEASMAAGGGSASASSTSTSTGSSSYTAVSSASTAPTAYSTSVQQPWMAGESTIPRQTTPPPPPQMAAMENVGGGAPAAAVGAVKAGRRTSKTTRFMELDTITSHLDSTFELPELRPLDARPSAAAARKHDLLASRVSFHPEPGYAPSAPAPAPPISTPAPSSARRASSAVPPQPSSQASSPARSLFKTPSPVVPQAPMPAPAMVPVVAPFAPPPPPEPASRPQSKAADAVSVTSVGRNKLQKKKRASAVPAVPAVQAPKPQKKSRWSSFKSGGQAPAVSV